MSHLFEFTLQLEEECCLVGLEESSLFALTDHYSVDRCGMGKELCLCRRRLERLLLLRCCHR